MKKTIVLFCLVVVAMATNAQKIFPGAIGFGTNSRGAYESSTAPVVLTVNSLEAGSVQTSTNSGSFEWCCAQNYPRVIVFATSGVIDYTQSASPVIYIENPYVNIYGQTALGNGITLLGCELSMNTHDVLIQHIKVRQSELNNSQTEYRCLSIKDGAYNVVVDHCSLTFGNTNLVAILNADKNITLSNCIVAYPLVESTYASWSGKPYMLGNCSVENADSNIAYIGNIVAFGINQHPATDNTRCLLLNNFHYAVRRNNVAGPTIFNESNRTQEYVIKGNKFLHASTSSWTWYSTQVQSAVLASSNIYVEDNISNMSVENPGYTEWECVSNSSECTAATTCSIDTTEFPSLTNAANVEDYVYSNAGAFNWDRDFVDQAVITNLQARDENYINSPAPMVAKVYDRYGKIGEKMASGYNFEENNVLFTVNGDTVRLTQNLTTQAEVIEAISAQLPEGVEVIDHPHERCSYLILQTKATGGTASITIGGDGTVLGFANGTYYGTDGIGGYPNFEATTHDLTSDLNMPASVDTDSDSDGYTDLEEWAHDMVWLDSTSTAIHSFNLKDNASVKLYPNPTAQRTTIEFSAIPKTDVRVTVYNIAGCAVYTNSYKPEKRILLDIEKKTTGIHFVELKYNNRTTIRKLVIERE